MRKKCFALRSVVTFYTVEFARFSKPWWGPGRSRCRIDLGDRGWRCCSGGFAWRIGFPMKGVPLLPVFVDDVKETALMVIFVALSMLTRFDVSCDGIFRR